MLSDLRFSLPLLLALPTALFAAASPAEPAPVPGLITAWSLSSPARISGIDLERYPDAAAQKKLSWTPARCAPSGWVDLTSRPQPPNSPSRIFARASLHATQAESRAFAFDFCGGLSLYLNGQILFRGQNSTTPSPEEFSASHTVWLPLASGDNELLLALTPSPAGSCAFAGRDLEAIYQHPGLTKLWELHGVLHAPESVVGDSARQVLYVSNYTGDSIAQVGFDGRLIAVDWATGVKRPTGLQLHDGRLYAVDRTGLAEFDPDTGRLLRHTPIEGAVFPNDLSFDSAGAAYITDTQSHVVSKIVAGRTQRFVRDPAIEQPNGLLVEPTRLLVGATKNGTLQSVDLATRQVTTFITLGAGALMDGLTADGRGGYLFSDYFGRIYHAEAAGACTLLLDRAGPRQFCADFGYVPEQHLLVVPSLFDERLTAYRLDLDRL